MRQLPPSEADSVPPSHPDRNMGRKGHRNGALIPKFNLKNFKFFGYELGKLEN